MNMVNVRKGLKSNAVIVEEIIVRHIKDVRCIREQLKFRMFKLKRALLTVC